MFKLVLNRQADHLAGDTAGRIFPHSLWSSLSPNFFLDEDARAACHCIEIVSICRGDEPGIAQDHGHAWVRLIEPSGAVYSVGFYPDESTNVEPDEVPGLRMPGILLSPDKYEKHHEKGWNCRTVRHSISQTCFNEAKEAIESMQLNRLEGSLAFDLCEYNCVQFVISIAAICGLTIRAQTSLCRLTDDIYFSGKLRSSCHFFLARFPKGVSASMLGAANRVRSIVFNSSLAMLGGFSILPRQWSKSANGNVLQLQVHQLKPIFASYKHVFSKRVPFLHVRALRQWQLRVNQQRGSNG